MCMHKRGREDVEKQTERADSEKDRERRKSFEQKPLTKLFMRNYESWLAQESPRKSWS